MDALLPLVAAASWAVALYLMVPDAQGGLARLRPRRAGPSWLEPRPGALSRGKRMVLAAASAVIVVVLVGAGPVASAVVAVVVFGAASFGLRFVSTEDPAARRDRLTLDLPEVLDLLAGALAAGVPLRRALRLVTDLIDGPVAEELGEVVARIDVGMPDAEAWLLLGDDPVLGETARDLARQVDSGTGVEQILRVRAGDARTEAAAVRQRWARTAGVRSALPLAACFLPAFVFIGIVPAVAGAIVALWPSW